MKKSDNQKEEIKKSSGKMRTDYFSKIKGALKSPFDNRYWKTLGIDLVYNVILAVIIILVVLLLFNSLKNTVSNPSVAQILEQLSAVAGSDNAEDMATTEILQQQITALMWPFLRIAMFVFLISVLIWFVLSTYFKGKIWKIIFLKKTNFNFLLKFAGFRLIIGIAFILIAGLSFAIASTTFFQIIFWIFVLLAFHLFSISLIYFIQNDFIFKSIKEGFKTGIKKIHLFLLPYLIMGILYGLLYLIRGGLSQIIVKTQIDFTNLAALSTEIVPYLYDMIPYLIITTIISLFFAAYLRIFYAEVVKGI